MQDKNRHTMNIQLIHLLHIIKTKIFFQNFNYKYIYTLDKNKIFMHFFTNPIEIYNVNLIFFIRIQM